MNSFSSKHYLLLGLGSVVILAGTGYLAFTMSRRPQLSALTVSTDTVTQGVDTSGLVQAQQKQQDSQDVDNIES